MPLPLAAARLFNTPLLVHPGKAAVILEAFGPRLTGEPVAMETAIDVQEPLRARMGIVGNRLGRAYARANLRPFTQVGNVAIIPVEGTLIHKGAFLGTSSGETSYEGLQAQIRAAGEASDIKGVVFEIDSFGGEAAGAADTAKLMRDLSAEKPTLAVLTDFALSAGYYLASQARQVVIPEGGYAGSIGAVIVHRDISQRLAAEGIKVTLLQSGAHKTDENPFEPLPEAVAAKIRNQLDASRAAFARDVALGRGKRLPQKAAMATEAEIYRGEDAVRMGLIDAVGHPSEAFDAFVSSLSRSGPPARQPSQKGNLMTKTVTEAAGDAATQTITTEAATAQAQAARQEGQAEGRKAGLEAGRAEGAAAERTRIAAILDAEEAKGRETLARHCAFATAMSADDAKAMLAAAPKAASEPAAPAKSPLTAAMEREGAVDLGPAGAPPAPVTEFEKGRARAAALLGKQISA